MSTTIRRRVARVRHICPGCPDYAGAIEPGEVYLEHKAFPGDDAGFATAAGHPVRMAECGHCASRYGRGELLAAQGGTR